jgi:GrpB-like predicted nucleotidyltransferase (UPF0157 family)
MACPVHSSSLRSCARDFHQGGYLFMKTIRSAIPSWIAALTIAALFCVLPAGAQSQGMPPQDRDSDMTRQQLATFDRFLDSHPELAEQLRKDPTLVNNEEFVENHRDLQQYLQQHPEVREELQQNPNAVMHQEQRYERREDREQDRAPNRDRDRNPDITRGELVNMDRFMDSHPEIAEQLRQNPSLVNDKKFVEGHPALQQFLAQHPGVREEMKENPSTFMAREQRFDQREDMRDRDVTRTELMNMDRFMDSHPEIAEQLRQNPSLVNDKKFVEGHPALQQFLAQHPGVREEMKENPSTFMAREQRFDQREDMRDRDVTRTELVNMDRFMDSHPEIAEQLRQNPSLVNDKKFVEGHPALQQFLAQHPGVREEYKENPSQFMRQEQSFDRRQDAGMRGNFGMRADQDMQRGEVASFNEFLETHNNIASELSKNPSLATNEEYVENHPALRDYLKANPKVREGLSQNPQAFLKSSQGFEASPKGTPKLPAEPKLK